MGQSSDDNQEIIDLFKNNGANHFEKKPTSLLNIQNILEKVIEKN